MDIVWSFCSFLPSLHGGGGLITSVNAAAITANKNHHVCYTTSDGLSFQLNSAKSSLHQGSKDIFEPLLELLLLLSLQKIESPDM